MWPTEDDWRASVPARLARAVERWGLRVGVEHDGGSVSHVVDVITPDGTDAVLKLSFPHREAQHEGAALRRWDGDGAVRLLDVDPDDPFVLLLERCAPGTPLSRCADLPAEERLTIAGGLLLRLWANTGAESPGSPGSSGSPGSPGSPFENVADVTAEWATLVEQRVRALPPALAAAIDPGLVRRGVDLLRTLPGSARRSVVVHGDANPGNVLAAGREPWLVIDPKPMQGDPGYDLCPLLGQVDDPFASADPRRTLRDRTALLADVTGEPVGRIAAWCTARSVESALWSADRGRPEDTETELRRAAVFDTLSS